MAMLLDCLTGLGRKVGGCVSSTPSTSLPKLGSTPNTTQTAVAPTAVATPLPVPKHSGPTDLLAGIGHVLLPIATLLLIVLVIVLLVLWLTASARARQVVAPRPETGPIAVNSLFDRASLVHDLIALGDLANSPAVFAQTERMLVGLGVTRVDAHDGDELDPSLHAVADTVPTADPSLSRRIERQLRPGWRRGSTVLRPADVAVWVTE